MGWDPPARGARGLWTYVRNVLHLPGHIVPFALIPVGYPDEEKETPDRYDKSRVHYNWWGEKRNT